MMTTTAIQASAGTEQQFCADTAAAFLRTVFRGQDRGFAVLHTLPERHSTFYDLTETDWEQRMSEAAMRLRSRQEVYYAVCSQAERLQRGRGGIQTVQSVPGLWADIDIWHPGSKRSDLPRSEEDAWQIIDRVPIRPTIVVRSGNGLHVYWLFREPVEVNTAAERQNIAGLSVAFLRFVQARAAEQGWHVDATADLARILRIPGAYNRKSDPPKLVTFTLTDGEPRSNPSEWAELLEYEDDTDLARTVSVEVGDHNLGADFGLIVEGCSWLRHTVEHADSLSEPEWYRALAVAGRCRDGRRIAHEISQGYPRYSPEETDRKLEQSCHASRAPRCSYVASALDPSGEHCRRCQHFGRINSPVKLGFRKPAVTIPAPEGQPRPQEPETVQQAVHRLIDHNDLAGVFRLVPHLAQLPEADLALLKIDLKKQFGREWPGSEFNRLVKAEQERANAERARIEVQSRPEWQRELIRSSSGTPKPILANAITALQLSPEWAGVLGFDEFSMRTAARKQAPIDGCKIGAPWEDDQYRRTAEWLQRNDICVQPAGAFDAVESVSRANSFHPVRDYLESLEWDGEPRVHNWLSEYLTVEQSEYTAAVGEKWLISAVARIFRPGCKVDTCLILEGEQGWRKSSALRVLGDPWFTDELPDLDSKDAIMQIHGVWIVELGELTALGRSETSQIKQFMSRSQDRYRPPFGRSIVDAPRQCVFAGTVNPGGNGYLRDETGGRRFWPTACRGVADLGALRRDRDQLWAEAVQRYRDGVVWYAVDQRLQRLMNAEAADRYEEDPWQPAIEMWTETLTPRYIQGAGATPVESRDGKVFSWDVLWHAIGKPLDRQTQPDLNRVGRCLTALGWKRRKVWLAGESRWAFVRE